MQLSIGKALLKMFDGMERADDTVLVESITPVCAAEKGAVTVDFALAPLCRRISTMADSDSQQPPQSAHDASGMLLA